MTPNAVPPDESERLSLLNSSRLLDTEADPAFDALVRLLAAQTACPVAMITLVDSHRVWAMARVGIEQRQFSRLDALHALDDELVAQDLRTDVRFKDSVWMTGPTQARVYASVPLRVQGHALGSVCVMSPEARDLSAAQWQGLKDTALTAATLVEARINAQRARKLEARMRTASLAGSDWLWETDDQGIIQWVSASLIQHTGLNPSAEIGLMARQLYTPRDDETRSSWERFLTAKARREPFNDAIADRQTARGTITVSISGVPVFNQSGRFMGYRGASRNITRQIAEEQLSRKADQLLRQAIESFNAGVMISSPEGRILLSNSSWRSRIGSDAVEGSLWPELLRKRIAEGFYPNAIGREDEFFEWRMGMADLPEPQEIRLSNHAWVLSKDHRLADGCVVHFSISISHAKRQAVALASKQAALEESQARLSAVLRALPDLWFVIDAEGRYESGHEDHALLMRPFSTLKGKPFGIEVPQALAEREMKAIAKAHATGKAQRLDYSLDLASGTRHFEARFTPMPDRQTLFLTRDMTEPMVAAERLRVSEELYRSVASSISDGLVVIRRDGSMVAINPAGCRILGIQASDIDHISSNDAFYQLLTDDLQRPLPREQWPLIRTLETGERLDDCVHPLRRRDGEIVWIQISSHMLRVNAEAAPFAVVATFRDITQGRQAAQALALSEERWKFALDGSGDGVWDWDAATDTVFYSQRWKTMLGYDDGEIGHGQIELTSRIHPDDREPVVAALGGYLEQDDGVFQAEFRMRHKLGHDVWILSRGKIVGRDAAGKPSRVVGTHSDITPIKRAEQVLREKQSAEAASAAKSEFLSRMSHEIRTPLNAVNGFAQLLKLQLARLPAAAQYLSFVDQILHGSQHLMALVNDVLDLQKVEAGILTLRNEHLTLLDEVRQCTAMLGPLAAQRGIALQVDIAPDHIVDADRQRLRQILMNIGSNAIKYNQAGGTVWFDAERQDDGALVLGIRDTGPGMSPQQLSRLFQPFERLGRETSSIEGSGLGLIITRSLIEAMGGNMDIRSQPGSGTRVSIVIPSVVNDAQPAANGTLNSHMDKPDGASATNHQREEKTLAEQAPFHVLYVEDNRINAMLFEEALRPYPQLSLEIAEDGQMALSMARDKAPDVLVLDAHLPGMSGFDVLRALRTLPQLEATPAFMCSADAMPDDVARAKAAGFEGYWTKPIDIHQVTTVLCQLAERGHNAAP